MIERDAIKYAVGRVAELCLPSLVDEINENRAPQRARRLKRAIIHARTRRASRRGDVPMLERELSNFWAGSAGDRFHATHNDHRFQLFLDQHAGTIIPALKSAMTGHDMRRLVEIGCGDGLVLDHCAEHFGAPLAYVGLDINAAAIDRARDLAGSAGKFQFIHTDAAQWLRDHPLAGTVILTNGGVFEYFSTARVQALLASVAGHGPTVIGLVEPLAPGHDLATTPGSQVFGRERSFSHNYPHLLAEAGFDVTQTTIRDHAGVRWIMVTGARNR